MDLPTAPLNPAILIGPGVLLVCGLAFVGTWLVARERSYLLIFAVACLLFVSAVCCHTFFVPRDPLSNAMVCSALYTSALLCLSVALIQRSNRQSRILYNAIVFAAFMATIAYFCYVEPSVTARVYTLNLGFGVVMLITVIRMTDLLQGRLADKVLFWATLAFAIHFFPRTILSVTAEISDGERAFTDTLYWTVLHITVTSFVVALALAILGTTTADVIDDLKRQRERDPLTGLLDQRGFERAAYAALRKKDRGSQALLLCEIEQLERINKRHGHAVGDDMVVSLAELIKTETFRHDVAGRMEGGEFAILLTDCDARRANAFALHLRNLASNTWGRASEASPTVRFGVVERQEDEDLWPMIARAANELRKAAAERASIGVPLTSDDGGAHPFRF